MKHEPIRLDRTPVHLGEDTRAHRVEDFTFAPAGFEQYMKRYCSSGPGRLVMIEHSKANWPAWERHPSGDEIVIAISGRATLIQEIDGTERRVPLGPGDAVVNPAGVWHTADVIEPLTAVYITPCPGTEHRERK
jgi:mannose-6-phosphate isomerase-like protein (cupin superfamily)